MLFSSSTLTILDTFQKNQKNKEVKNERKTITSIIYFLQKQGKRKVYDKWYLSPFGHNS